MVPLCIQTFSGDYYSRFGRPFWYRFYTSSTAKQDYRLVVELAIRKLNARAEFPTVDDDAVIAVLTMIFDIGVDATSQLARDLVQSRCAILASISDSRNVLHTNYAAGEFPLAHGALELLRRYAPWSARWTILARYSRLRSLNLGLEGELLGRLILSEAYITAKPREPFEKNIFYWDTIKNYRGDFDRLAQKPITVADYLQSLMVAKFYNPAVLSSQLGTLANGRVHLLQWVTMSDDPNPLTLAKAWLLGCGLICKPNSIAVDLLIPVVLDTAEPPSIPLSNSHGTLETTLKPQELANLDSALSQVMSVISTPA